MKTLRCLFETLSSPTPSDIEDGWARLVRWAQAAIRAEDREALKDILIRAAAWEAAENIRAMRADYEPQTSCTVDHCGEPCLGFP